MPQFRPTHTAYTIRDYTKKETGEIDSSWTKIGVAFLHRDGKGVDVVLDALPINGRVALRLITPKKEKKGEAE